MGNRRTHNRFLDFLSTYWKTLLIVGIPLALLPLPLVAGTDPAKCGYVILLMALYWMCDLLPLAITSLIPVALFPMMGIMDTGSTSMQYMKSTCMLVLVSLIVALSIEHCNLHRRIALNAIRVVGLSPRLLMLGFMLPTFFLSMWISNNATTAMMLPILEAVLLEMEQNDDVEAVVDIKDVGIDSDSGEIREEARPRGVDGGGCSSDDEEFEQVIKQTSKKRKREKKRSSNYRSMMSLSICYAANLGGTATIIGTAPNLILIENLEDFPDQPLTFLSWMGFAIPMALLLLLCAWAWLQMYFMGIPKPSNKKMKKEDMDDEDEMEAKTVAIRAMIAEKCRELGGLSFHESSVTVAFLALVLLWFFRSPGFMTGWGDLLKTTNAVGNPVSVSDATPTAIIAILLFIFPAKSIFFRQLFDSSINGGKFLSSPALIDWKTVLYRLPWGIILLLGGGYALAEGSEQSCLSYWIGQQLTGLGDLDDWVLLLVVSIIMMLVTQLVSNSAAAAMIIPILKVLALTLQINPLYLMYPPTLLSSYAFMLPVSSGPNALAFPHANMSTFKMLRVGFGMNLISLVVVMLAANSYGAAMFDFKEFPTWAEGGTSGGGANGTDPCAP